MNESTKKILHFIVDKNKKSDIVQEFLIRFKAFKQVSPKF